MSAAEKFMFDLTFDNEVDPSQETETNDENIIEDQEPEIIVPTFSEEEVEIARQQGYEAGKEEGLAATTEILTKQINETLIKIDEKLIPAFQKQDSMNHEISRAAHSLAFSICKKMMPAMAKQNSFGEVEKVIEEVFSKVLEDPRITIVVHADMVEAIELRLKELAEEREFKGRIHVKENKATESSDCRVDWANGGIERNTKELWANITSILNRNIGEKPTIWDNPEEIEVNNTENTDYIVETEEPVPSVDNNMQVETPPQKKDVEIDTDECEQEQPVDQFKQTKADD